MVSGYIPNTMDKSSESHEEFWKSMQSSNNGDAGSERNITAYTQWEPPFAMVCWSGTHLQSACQV